MKRSHCSVAIFALAALLAVVVGMLFVRTQSAHAARPVLRQANVLVKIVNDGPDEDIVTKISVRRGGKRGIRYQRVLDRLNRGETSTIDLGSITFRRHAKFKIRLRIGDERRRVKVVETLTEGGDHTITIRVGESTTGGGDGGGGIVFPPGYSILNTVDSPMTSVEIDGVVGRFFFNQPVPKGVYGFILTSQGIPSGPRGLVVHFADGSKMSFGPTEGQIINAGFSRVLEVDPERVEPFDSLKG